MKSDSCICIMIVTISLEMRVNILNVKCTVIWRFSISNDIVNVWQCVRHEERDFNQISHVFIFLKYWAFDLKDCENFKNNYNVSQTENYEVSETESVETVAFTQSQSQKEKIKFKIKIWSAQNLIKRKTLSETWRRIINDTCHYKKFFSHLKENKLTAEVERILIFTKNCCSLCNFNCVSEFITLFTQKMIQYSWVNSCLTLL